MKRKKGIILLILTAVSSLLLFSGCKEGHHPHGTIALDYVAEVLDLTEPQQTKLESIRDELKEQAEKLHAQKGEMHEALKEQLARESIDKEVIRQLVDEHRRNTDEILELAIDRLADFHADLSPQQREKLVAKLEKFEKYHRNHYN